MALIFILYGKLITYMIPLGFRLSKGVIVVWKFSDSNPGGGGGGGLLSFPELPSSEIKVGEIFISEVLSMMIPQANLVPALPEVVVGSKVSSLA